MVVSPEELIRFPQSRFQMELYYDGECFIYTDDPSKFIVHPNYKMKVNRDLPFIPPVHVTFHGFVYYINRGESGGIALYYDNTSIFLFL